MPPDRWTISTVYTVMNKGDVSCVLSAVLFSNDWSAILQYCNAGDVMFTRIRFWPHNEAWRISHTMLFYLSHWGLHLWGWWSVWHFNWLWRLCICQCWPNASGKQYKRAVRGLTLVYEAMMRYLTYLMVSFFKWCEQKAYTICGELWNQLIDVQVPVGE